MDVVQELLKELADRNLRINVEYYEHSLPYVSISDPETNEDCIKTCIAKGLFYAQKRREKKFQSLVSINVAIRCGKVIEQIYYSWIFLLFCRSTNIWKHKTKRKRNGCLFGSTVMLVKTMPRNLA